MAKKTVTDSEEKKPRKVLSGPIREKARTIDKLIAAVGKVIQKQGYQGLNIANISKVAGTDRRLVYTYFGSLDNLVEAYVKQKDYWNSEAKKQVSDIVEKGESLDSQQVVSLLQGQFDSVLKDKALQKIIHWELGESNKILRKISDNREELGEELFKLGESEFDTTNIDIRAILALQIGGLYYLALHSKSNGSLFCGIDLNGPEGKKRIDKAMEKVVELCYKEIKD